MRGRFIVLIPTALLAGCGVPATVGSPVDESHTATIRTVIRGVEQASPDRWYAFIDRIDGEEVDYPGWDLHRPSVALRWGGHPVRFPAGVRTIDGAFGTKAGASTGPLPGPVAVPFHGRFFAHPGHTYEVVVTIAIGQHSEELEPLAQIPLSAGVRVIDTTDPAKSPVTLSIRAVAN